MWLRRVGCVDHWKDQRFLRGGLRRGRLDLRARRCGGDLRGRRWRLALRIAASRNCFQPMQWLGRGLWRRRQHRRRNICRSVARSRGRLCGWRCGRWRRRARRNRCWRCRRRYGGCSRRSALFTGWRVVLAVSVVLRRWRRLRWRRLHRSRRNVRRHGWRVRWRFGRRSGRRRRVDGLCRCGRVCLLGRGARCLRRCSDDLHQHLRSGGLRCGLRVRRARLRVRRRWLIACCIGLCGRRL